MGQAPSPSLPGAPNSREFETMPHPNVIQQWNQKPNFNLSQPY